jgi:hypothetical protein
MADSEEATYSVSFRLQRITTEDAFVSVPISADTTVMQSDGKGRLDVPKMVQKAIQMGQAPDVLWKIESQNVEMHPLQIPPPELA